MMTGVWQKSMVAWWGLLWPLTQKPEEGQKMETRAWPHQIPTRSTGAVIGRLVRLRSDSLPWEWQREVMFSVFQLGTWCFKIVRDLRRFILRLEESGLRPMVFLVCFVLWIRGSSAGYDDDRSALDGLHLSLYWCCHHQTLWSVLCPAQTCALASFFYELHCAVAVSDWICLPATRSPSWCSIYPSSVLCIF